MPERPTFQRVLVAQRLVRTLCPECKQAYVPDAEMLRSTGLAKFAEAYPDRWFDVGIAEQHAVTSAAGLAMGGMHPVVALYSTFLNRADSQSPVTTRSSSGRLRRSCPMARSKSPATKSQLPHRFDTAGPTIPS